MFNFNHKEKGQGLVEYALILVLIAIVVIVAMRVLGNKVSDTFGTVNTELAGGGGDSNEAAASPPEIPARIEGDAARTQYCNERPGWVGGVNWGFAGGHEWTTDGQTYYVTGEPFNCPYP